MRVWVTGASGQVGWEVLSRAYLFPDLSVQGTDSGQVDITCIEQVEQYVAANRPDLIINTAAYTAVDRAETEQERAYAVNATGVANLVAIATASDIPLLHISTDYVFDGTSSLPYTEADLVTRPLGVYGKSKLQGELLVRSYPKGVVLRTSWVFGRHGHNFPKTMLKLGQAGKDIRVVCDQRGGPTYAGHLAQALLGLTSRYKQIGSLPWGLYHYCGQPDTTWLGLAAATLERAVARGLLACMPKVIPISTSEYPTPASRPLNSVLNCQKFSTFFPDIALSQWQEGVDEVVAYWSSYGAKV